MKFEGKIGKYKAQMLLDSGADSSARLVEESEYLGKYVEATGLGGSLRVPLAKVWLSVENYKIPMVALVVEQKIDDVLIGRDIGPVFKVLLLLNLGEIQRWVLLGLRRRKKD